MTVELIVRTAACTSALILAVALARAPQASVSSRAFGAALCLGVASYLACSGSPAGCSAAWLQPALLLAIEVPFFFWGWTASIVDDEFELSAVPALGAALLLAVGAIGMTTSSPRSDAITVAVHSVLGIGFVIAALVNVLRGWRQDLVEARRRLRVLIVVLCGTYSIGIMAVEFALAGRPASAELMLLNAVLLTLLLFGLACVVLSVSSPVQAAFGWAPPANNRPVEPARVPARDREQEIVERLQELMTRGAAYRDADLAIASLANRLGVAEKKLREVINRRLGFKNFSSFVNAFRLEEVRLRLLDPRQDATPILTMALEAGFGSVVAFNRAFKEKHGATPTAFRANRNNTTNEGESADAANHQ